MDFAPARSERRGVARKLSSSPRRGVEVFEHHVLLRARVPREAVARVRAEVGAQPPVPPAPPAHHGADARGELGARGPRQGGPHHRLPVARRRPFSRARPARIAPALTRGPSPPAGTPRPARGRRRRSRASSTRTRSSTSATSAATRGARGASAPSSSRRSTSTRASSRPSRRARTRPRSPRARTRPSPCPRAPRATSASSTTRSP